MDTSDAFDFLLRKVEEQGVVVGAAVPFPLPRKVTCAISYIKKASLTDDPIVKGSFRLTGLKRRRKQWKKLMKAKGC